MMDIMREKVVRDYSWSLPNRRCMDGVESIAAIINTSTSIWCRLQILETFWSEERQVALEIQPE